MQVSMAVGQFVKNLRQEACRPNKSKYYTSMLLNFQELNQDFLGFSKTIKTLNRLGSCWTTIQQQLTLIKWGELGPICDAIAFDIWQWAAEQQISVSAVNIPGSENVLQQTKTIHKMFLQQPNIYSCPLRENQPGEDTTQCCNSGMISVGGKKPIICYQM